MEKTIKMIDLLYKIANGEEAPKKIRYFGEEFKLAKDNEYYSVHSSRPLISYFGEDYLRDELNDEVEIIDEEEFEDIEEIETSYGGDCKHRIFESNGVSYEVSPTMKNKINQLIKNQKKIIERLNKEN